MLKRAGFTLIELLISITVLMLLVGTGVIALNNFSSRQKVKAVQDEMIANIKLARNYATTMQLPNGTAGKLNFVEVQIDAKGQIKVIAHDAGTTYFTGPSYAGVKVDVSPVGSINFGAYKGNSIGGDVTITITSDGNALGTLDTSVIKVVSSGLVYAQ